MNLLFCGRIAPRQALRGRSATQVILTPTPRSQLSYKGHSLALHTSIFGSGYRGFGQGLPQFYGEVPFFQATKNPAYMSQRGLAPRPLHSAGSPDRYSSKLNGDWCPRRVPPYVHSPTNAKTPAQAVASEGRQPSPMRAATCPAALNRAREVRVRPSEQSQRLRLLLLRLSFFRGRLRRLLPALAPGWRSGFHVGGIPGFVPTLPSPFRPPPGPPAPARAGPSRRRTRCGGPTRVAAPR